MHQQTLAAHMVFKRTTRRLVKSPLKEGLKEGLEEGLEEMAQIISWQELSAVLLSQAEGSGKATD